MQVTDSKAPTGERFTCLPANWLITSSVQSWRLLMVKHSFKIEETSKNMRTQKMQILGLIAKRWENIGYGNHWGKLELD